MEAVLAEMKGSAELELRANLVRQALEKAGELPDDR